MGEGILKRKIGIEHEVDEFLDRVSEGAPADHKCHRYFGLDLIDQ